jgi:mono/diheme cytochrome c family protein
VSTLDIPLTKPYAILLICLFLACRSSAADATFQKTVEPFLAKNCILCHNAKIKTAEVNLDYHDAAAVLKDRDIWENVLGKLRSGEMPPKGAKQPRPEDVKAVAQWIEAEFARIDRNTKPDPGRVTAHRLNRFEYNNTVRDLLAVDFHPAEDFPADDAGYGFDNIGDVLSLSPVLMEKYFAAAERIAKKAIFGDPVMKATVQRYKDENLKPAELARLGIQIQRPFPVDAIYEIRGGVRFKNRPTAPVDLKIGFWIDDRRVNVADLQLVPGKPPVSDIRIPFKEGQHGVRIAVIDDRTDSRNANFYVDYVEVRGPFQTKAAGPPEAYKRIFVCGHAPGQHAAECARRVLAELAHRAYRRPVTKSEVDGLVNFVSLAQKEGDGFEQGIQLALQAILVSPHFLFRIERDARPADPTAVHPISDLELASRLSYFLWSSLPDSDLLAVAEKKALRKPGVLEAQVRRMLADPKSSALVENFAGQWLQIRNLDTVKPDPERFPDFDGELREAMRQETRLFFDSIVKEDRSILDFIDGKFTFLNARLARHYGIPGVEGDEFRRVALSGDQRGGILTHASVLTVSSYPTRTSPVLRGKWILDNILNAPPPPPPPGVPNLKEEAVGATGTLRQQLEQHRSDQSCAACHSKMDPLGFGLENYDAIGAWRTRDGKFPIDVAGTLPNGKSFDTPGGLKTILKGDREAFTQCVTEKMLTYALGRGLERYDKNAVKSIGRGVAAGDYKFSRLILEIVNSMPFQMRRGDGKKI